MINKTTRRLDRRGSQLMAAALAAVALSAESAQAQPAAPGGANPTPPPQPALAAQTPLASAVDPSPAPAPTASAAFQFTDGRPAEERKTRQYLTLWRYSCAFGVQDLGDEFVDRVGQLRHDLLAAYGPRLAASAVVVGHYHLYLNQRAMQGSHSYATAVVGVLAITAGANAKTTAPACAKDKMPEGWFAPSELTTPWSPFIAEVEISVDGQVHKIHSVYSPPKNMPAPGIVGSHDMVAEQEAVHAAVDKANAAVIADIATQFHDVPATAPVGSQ